MSQTKRYTDIDRRWTSRLFLAGATIIVLFGNTGLMGPADAIAPDLTGCDDDRPVHPPISITEDVGPQGFVLGHHPLTGEPLYRPGSGVVGGTGTAEDPYRIAGWCIPGARAIDTWHGSESGVAITGTRSHVVIQDNVVSGPGFDIAFGIAIPDVYLTSHVNGFAIKQAEHVSIVENTVMYVYHGVRIIESPGVSVASNLFSYNIYGVLIDDSTALDYRGNSLIPDPIWNGGTVFSIIIRNSTDSVIRDNIIIQANLQAIMIMEGSHRAVVRNNTLSDAVTAVDVYRADDVRIEGNQIRESAAPLRVHQAHDIRIEQNTFTDNRRGITVTWSDRMTFANNTVLRHAEHGIRFDEADNPTIKHNQIGQNEGNGIIARYGQDMTLHGNKIEGNDGIGILIIGHQRTTMTENAVLNHTTGVSPRAAMELVMNRNDIVGNDIGLDSQLSVWTLDARSNWWGCPDGPDDSACDPVIGPVAVYDPWLTEPSTEGGDA